VTTGLAPMKGVERTNTVVVRGQGQRMEVSPRRDLYTMEIDHKRNCYACGGFGHMAQHCRNRGQGRRVVERRRLEYRGGRIESNIEQIEHLKEEENLEALD